MARQIERIEVLRLSPKEQQQWREALVRADKIREQLLRSRGGRPFRPVSEDIAAIREERDDELP
jgi:hypothetical protein